MLDVFIVSTGNELTSGRSVDTNSSWIGNKLSSIGIQSKMILVLPDDPEVLYEEIKRISNLHHALIILTGGLGPTQDDYTLETVCKLTGANTVVHEESYKKLESIVRSRGNFSEEIFAIVKRQTLVPNTAFIFPNEKGIAPGFLLSISKNSSIVCMPGVPSEMKHMFQNYVFDYILKKFYTSDLKWYFRYRFLWDVLESDFQKHFIQENNFQNDKGLIWGVTAKKGLIKVTFLSKDENIVENIVQKLDKEYKSASTLDLLEEIPTLLIQKKSTLSIAESCTGGLLSKIITDRPGSSQYFLGGVVSYDNEVKINILNVQKETLGKNGAVSLETAKEMVIGIQKIINSDFAISITGIAGPASDMTDKKVGLVYIGLMKKGEEPIVFEFNINRDRETFREIVASKALYLLYIHYLKQ